MIHTLSAVYEGGVLRPTEPLALNEHQRVSITVCDATPDPAEPWLDHEYMAAIAMDEPTIEEVQRILSGVSGTLSDAIREERDARG